MRDVTRMAMQELEASSRALTERCGAPFGDAKHHKGAISRTLPPVSVGLRTIETGGTFLAQRQGPWAFVQTCGRHKSREIRLFGGDIRDDVAARA